MKNTIMAILLIFSLVGLSVSVAGCHHGSNSASTQTATAKLGNISVDVTATGNLALSKTEDLAFQVDGTVEEVLVQAGDAVEQGQVLAQLDQSQWNEYLAQLKDNVTAAQRNVSAKELALTAAQRDVLAKQLGLLQAQQSLTSALDALDKAKEPYSSDDINNARVTANLAQNAVDVAQTALGQAMGSANENQILQAYASLYTTQQALATAQQKLQTMLDAPDLQQVAIQQLQVQIAQERLKTQRQHLTTLLVRE